MHYSPLELGIVVMFAADDDNTSNLQLALARPRELLVSPKEEVRQQLIALHAAVRALLPRAAARSQG